MIGAAVAPIAVVVFVVGLLFIPMAVAFGRLCAALALVQSLLAGVGFRLRPDISLDRLWAADGLIKIGFGYYSRRTPAGSLRYALSSIFSRRSRKGRSTCMGGLRNSCVVAFRGVCLLPRSSHQAGEQEIPRGATYDMTTCAGWCIVRRTIFSETFLPGFAQPQR
jgi:hypothetical protein